MLARLLTRLRRPAAVPAAVPPLTRVQAIEQEIHDLELALASGQHAGTPTERVLRFALADARMAYQYHSVPRVLPAPRQDVAA